LQEIILKVGNLQSCQQFDIIEKATTEQQQ